MRRVIASVGGHWQLVAAGMMMTTMVTVCFYLITAYTPTFDSSLLRLGAAASLGVTLCVGISNFIWVPVMGAWSDQIGRRPLLRACAILTLLTAYPAIFWLVAAPSVTRLLTVEFWLSLMFGGYR